VQPVPPPRVLLVDDDPDVLQATSAVLRDWGYSVDEARDGGTALTLLRSARPDVMLVDLMMPVMDIQPRASLDQLFHAHPPLRHPEEPQIKDSEVRALGTVQGAQGSRVQLMNRLSALSEPDVAGRLTPYFHASRVGASAAMGN